MKLQHLFAIMALAISANSYAANSEPCSSDISRIKAVAASEISAFEIDGEGHKAMATADSFDSAGVYVSNENDAAVLSLSGKAKVNSAAGESIYIEAQALCSPTTGKYELMGSKVHN